MFETSDTVSNFAALRTFKTRYWMAQFFEKRLKSTSAFHTLVKGNVPQTTPRYAICNVGHKDS